MGEYVWARLGTKGQVEDRSGRLCEAHGEVVLERGGRWYPAGDSGLRRAAHRPAKKVRVLRSPAKKKRQGSRRAKRRKKSA